MEGKRFVIGLFMVAVLICSCYAAAEIGWEWGSLRGGAQLLFRQSQRLSPNGLLFRKHHVNFSSGTNITYILARDLWRDGTNGRVELLSGGVAQNSVKLLVTSQRARGAHFDIMVYGE